MENKIDFQMTAVEKQAIQDAIELIKTNTPWRIVLTPDERSASIHLGEKSFALVEKTRDYMLQNPHLVPSYIDVAAFLHDVDAARNLNEMLRLLAPVTQSLEDTLTLTGMDAMAAAMVFYNAVKIAAQNNAEGAEVIYTDLKQRFVNRGRKPAPGAGTAV